MIIAFGHQRRRGKDTCAKFMETALKVTYPRILVQRVSFADSLKNSCHQLYGWAGLQPGVYYENHPAEKEAVLPLIGKSPRDIWIDFGMAMREKVWPDTFAAKVLHTITQNNPKAVFLITDLRFLNEANMIKDAKGTCILVERDNMGISTDKADTALNGWTGWDFVIKNNGTLTDLSQSVAELITKIHI